MADVTEREQSRWWVLALVGALVTPVCAILWLGVTLTSEPASLPAAMVKILFTIVAVGTAALGAKWRTTSGTALLIEALVVVVWMLVRADIYSTAGLVRTSLLLAAPLFLSGVSYVLAGGMAAGTWPPARFKRAR
ncbi:MAG: hypothetical protein JXB46_00055 [Candidatus Eisenbacteria bacterium]|nr:hypothetical protein [Candidatus Eisenbacteria bacterium]